MPRSSAIAFNCAIASVEPATVVARGIVERRDLQIGDARYQLLDGLGRCEDAAMRPEPRTCS